MRRPVLVGVNEFILMPSARSASKMIRAVIVILLTSSTLARSTEQLNRRVQSDHALQEAYRVGEGSGTNADRTARSLNDGPQERALSSQEIFNDESSSDDEKNETLQRVPKCSYYYCNSPGNRGSGRLANDESLRIQERELGTLVKILNAIGPNSVGRMSELDEHRMRQHLMDLGRFTDRESARPFTRNEVAAMITKLHEMSRGSNPEMVKDRIHPQNTAHTGSEELKTTPPITHEELKSMVDKLHAEIFKKNGTEKSDDAERQMMNELSQQLTKLMESKELMNKLRSKRFILGSARYDAAIDIAEQEVEKGEPGQGPDSLGNPLTGGHGLVDNAETAISDVYCKAEAIRHGHTRIIGITLHQVMCELRNLHKLIKTMIMNLKDELLVFIHIKFGEEKELLDDPIELFIRIIDDLATEPERLVTFLELIKESIPLTEIKLVIDRIQDAGRTILRVIYNVINELDGGVRSPFLETIYLRLSQLLGDTDDDSDSSKTTLTEKIATLREVAQAVSTAMSSFPTCALSQVIKSQDIAEMMTKVQLRVREHIANRPTLPLNPSEITETSVEEKEVVKKTEDCPTLPSVEEEIVKTVEKDSTVIKHARPRPFYRKFSKTEEEEDTVYRTPNTSPPKNLTPAVVKPPDLPLPANALDLTNVFVNSVSTVPVPLPSEAPKKHDVPRKQRKFLSKVMSRIDSIMTKTATIDTPSSDLLSPSEVPTITTYEEDSSAADDVPVPVEDDGPTVTTTTHAVKTTEVDSDVPPEIAEPNVISRTSTAVDTITSNDQVPIISENVKTVHITDLPNTPKTEVPTPSLPGPSELGQTALIETGNLPNPCPTLVNVESPSVPSFTETRKSATVTTTKLTTPESPEDERSITEERTRIQLPLNPTATLTTTSETDTVQSTEPVDTRTPTNVPKELSEDISVSTSVGKISVTDDVKISPTIDEIQVQTSDRTSTDTSSVESTNLPVSEDLEDDLPGRIPNALSRIPTRLRNVVSRITSTISTPISPTASETSVITEVQEQPQEAEPLPPPPVLPDLRNILLNIPHNHDRSPITTDITETKTIVSSKEVVPDDRLRLPKLPHLHRYRGYDVSIREREYPGRVRYYPDLPPYQPLKPTIEPPVDPLSLNVVPYNHPPRAPWPSSLGRCIMSGRVRPPFALSRETVAATIGRDLLKPGDIVVIRLHDNMAVYGLVYDDVGPITFNILHPSDVTSLIRNGKTIWNLIADDFPDPECDTLFSNAQPV